MKRNVLLHFLTVCSLIAITACNNLNPDNSYYSRELGSEIKFGVKAPAFPETKANYSGAVNDGYEKITWEEGDMMRIYCAEASDPESHYEDYFIKSGSISNDSERYSRASIDHNAGNTGLRWGSGIHNFYAIYPSPSVVNTNTLSEGSASYVLPVTQNSAELKKDNTSLNWIAIPDVEKYLPMAAAVKGEQSDIEAKEVFLSFSPLSTAIQFTLKNSYDNVTTPDMNVLEISISSTSTNLTGKVTANLSGWTGENPTCTLSNGGKTVTVPFGTVASPLSVAYEKTLTFTAFFQPTVAIQDLLFSITTVESGITKTISTKINHADGSTISFAPFQKHIVKGLVSTGEISWIEVSTITVTNWRGMPEEDKDFKTN